MLGFSPISARPLSGGPSGLVQIVEQISGTLAIGFAVSATAGAIVHPRATVGISFPIAAHLIVHQAIGGTISISFGGASALRVAGKPIILRAVPQSYELRAAMQQMRLTALPQSYTVRGSR